MGLVPHRLTMVIGPQKYGYRIIPKYIYIYTYMKLVFCFYVYNMMYIDNIHMFITLIVDLHIRTYMSKYMQMGGLTNL